LDDFSLPLFFSSCYLFSFEDVEWGAFGDGNEAAKPQAPQNPASADLWGRSDLVSLDLTTDSKKLKEQQAKNTPKVPMNSAGAYGGMQPGMGMGMGGMQSGMGMQVGGGMQPGMGMGMSGMQGTSMGMGMQPAMGMGGMQGGLGMQPVGMQTAMGMGMQGGMSMGGMPMQGGMAMGGMQGGMAPAGQMRPASQGNMSGAMW
jgi:hypothetical protein